MGGKTLRNVGRDAHRLGACSAIRRRVRFTSAPHNELRSLPLPAHLNTAKMTSTALVDVLIIGGGMGGLSAGATAAELGVKVLLVEKGDRIGGSAQYVRLHTKLSFF